MLVCPACQSRFVGGETFCPNDGTKLVDARELSPGELTGSKLEGVVRLDKLAYSDAFAERYTGRLLESRRAVYVTVFNQSFRVAPTATSLVETARAKVGSPMPLQINTLLQTHFDKTIPFYVESEPRGPSIRALLAEKRALPWMDAVRITANLARAMQWLHEQGVPHCAFHPSSIFVTRLAEGKVVVGDWALEALFPPDSAERRLEENPNAFAGYVDYMAPEIARATEKADTRSAVYALGCLLYEMILGKVPLPGKGPAEVLKRHQHEKPVRLSIAVGGGDLPPQLDDILEMMLAKDPDKRFQSPAAAVAALSNLVEESPDILAPAMERAAETDVDDLYGTLDMESVDRAEIERMDEDDALKPTLALTDTDAEQLRSGAVSTAGPVSGISATSDVDDTTPEGKPTRPSTGKYTRPAAVRAPQPEDATNELLDPHAPTHPSASLGAVDLEQEDGRKTLMIGGTGTPAITATSPEVDDANKKTLLHFSGKSTPALTGPPSKLSRKQKKKVTKSAPNGKSGELAALDASPTDKTIRVNVDVAAVERQLQTPPGHAEPPPRSERPTQQPGQSNPHPPLASAPVQDSSAVQEALAAAAPEAFNPDNVRDHTREIDRSSWFTGNDDEMWESSLAHEAAAHSERSNKTIVALLVGGLVVLAFAAIAYFEFFSVEEEPGEENPVAVTTPDEPDAPEVDVAAIRASFDAAFASGRLVEPIGNSAVSHLEELKRHAADSALFTEARDQFVEAARVAAKKADKDGDLRTARSLAGHASQLAPDDEELRTMTDEFQARFTGAAGAPDAGAGADMGPDLGDEEEPAEEPPAEVATAKPDKKKKKTRRPKKPKKPTKWAKSAKSGGSGDAASIAKEARAAHKSGSVDQAKKLYKSALAADPKNALALSGLGKLFFDKAKYRDAVKYQTKAVRYAPGRNDYRIALGQSYYRLGKYNEAIGVWERVLARDPNNSTAKQYVALAKRKLGR